MGRNSPGLALGIGLMMAFFHARGMRPREIEKKVSRRTRGRPTFRADGRVVYVMINRFSRRDPQ